MTYCLTVSGELVRDRRAERRQETVAEIIEAAWVIAREQGLAAITIRDLGARVGMRGQSVYVYFPSKHAIYDAMFAAANAELVSRYQDPPPFADPVDELRWVTRIWVEFCIEDAARYQLLYQRLIPGFEPSPESYAIAITALEVLIRALRRLDVIERIEVDLWTAVFSGLVAQQLANEPGGRRWADLCDKATDMFLLYIRDHKEKL